MPTWRAIIAHAVTATVTLSLVLVVLGGRLGAQRPGLPVPRTVTPPTATPPPPAPPTGGPAVPAVAPPDLPAELLKQVDADEQVNIRVYAAANKGVVNITTASEGGG